ncbi:hypothetical protein GCM10022236_27330 [Microlunatus ginsengisoli]|uniref:Uncharacterized protein n=1 Tax=Microlunatus ginsengisoli TaxID=363863 RepID=A0ABP7A270_9ACTN
MRLNIALRRSPILARAIGNPPGVFDPRVVNTARWRKAEVPAVTGHGMASATQGFAG